jgi:hypothetical protein
MQKQEIIDILSDSKKMSGFFPKPTEFGTKMSEMKSTLEGLSNFLISASVSANIAACVHLIKKLNDIGSQKTKLS